MIRAKGTKKEKRNKMEQNFPCMFITKSIKNLMDKEKGMKKFLDIM